MAVVNYDSELRRAGAHATHGWRRATFLAKRYVLGTIGLTIMLLFVWTALSADFICRFDPLTVNSAHRLAHPSLAALDGHRFVRPRRLEPDRAWRAHFARGRHRLDRAGIVDRRDDRARLGLPVGLGRSGVPARHRHPASTAAIGAGAGDDRGARPVAAQRDPGDCDPADPDRRARDPRQHAGAARTAVRRGCQVDRHERDAHRVAPCAAEHHRAA